MRLRTIALIPLMVLISVSGSIAQDSTMARKTPKRLDDNMPTRKGKGSAKKMPSPKYYRVPPTDTFKIDKSLHLQT